MRSDRSWVLDRGAPALVWLALAPFLAAQFGAVLTAVTPQMTTGKRGGALVGKVTVELHGGYHVNSHQPNDEYLIPLRLSWNPAPLVVERIEFPEPQEKNYAFSSKPVSVFTGDLDILTHFKVPAGVALGPHALTGRLRYQACDENSCLPPRTIEVRLPIRIQAE